MKQMMTIIRKNIRMRKLSPSEQDQRIAVNGTFHRNFCAITTECRVIRLYVCLSLSSDLITQHVTL